MSRILNFRKKILAFISAAVCLVALQGGEAHPGRLVAEWDFSSGIPDGINGSGQKIKMTVKSEKIITEKVEPELSPKAFRLTTVFRMPSKAFREQYLWQNQTPGGGFSLRLSFQAGSCIPRLTLGHNGGQDLISGSRMKLKPGEIYTLVCEYDGNDQVIFSLNGKARQPVRTTVCGNTGRAVRRTEISSGAFKTSPPYAGLVQKVRLESLPCREISASAAYRCAFFRNEQNARLDYLLINDTGKKLKNLSVTFSGKDNILSGKIEIPGMNRNERKTIQQKVFTVLAQGAYPCKASVKAVDTAGKTYSGSYDFVLRIAPIQHPSQKHGIWLATSDYYAVPKNWGINHIMNGALFTYGHIPEFYLMGWQRSYFQLVDDVICGGMSFTDQSVMHSVHPFRMGKRYPRYDINGKPYRHRNPDVMNPELLSMCKDYAAKFAGILKGHPAVTGFQATSEVRDLANPSFTEYYRDAYRKYASADIPKLARGKRISYHLVPSFPASRIIPDDDPLLKYYRWYWKFGDGWNQYQNMMCKTFSSALGHKVTTFYDPAVRVPPIWGSGGNVDVISHWFYPHDPFDVSYMASELQAMARGCKDQKISLMIQGILYRRVAPADKKIDNPPAWAEKHPKDKYITTAPDLMREALWSCFTRQCDGVLVFAIRALVDYFENGGHDPDNYAYTNSETKEVIGEIYRNTGKPFGPVFRLIPERKPEVAVLESDASSIFAGRGTWGWTGWIWDCASILNLANLQPYTIYEEEIARDGLGSIKVLFMPHCDVLTETTYRKIREFQKNGGLVVGDKFLPPVILPDFNLAIFTHTKQPDKDKAEMQKQAAALLKKLAPYYRPYAGSDNADLRLWVRTSGKNDDWLFVINDKRTFGDYIGQYRVVMEKGLPNAGTVSVRRKAGVVYDLLAHKEVPFLSENGITRIRTEFKTNDGRLYLFRDEPFEKMTLRIPDRAARGEKIDFAVQLRNAALVPLQITVTDPAGNRTDDSCYAALENGNYRQSVTIPLNVRPGVWTVQVRNLADNQTVSGKFAVAARGPVNIPHEEKN